MMANIDHTIVQGSMVKTHWKLEKLESLCNFFTDGDWIESKDQSQDGIRLIQTGNIGNGFFKGRSEKSRYISEQTFTRLKCTEIFEGDCLISRLPDPVGRSCIMPNTGEKMITAVDCTIVRFNQTKIIPDFFCHYTQSATYKRDIDSLTTGTTRSRISRGNLGNILIPLPPLDEQRRIVDILNHASSIKRLRDDAKAKAREIIPALFVEMFGDPASNPKGWDVLPLGDVIEKFEGGKNLQSGEDVSDDGSGLRILKVSAVTSGFFRPEENKPAPNGYNPPISHFVREGDLLFSRANTAELVGATALVGFQPNNLLLPDKLWRFVWKKQSKVISRFVLHFLQQRYIRDSITRMATGTSDSMKNVSQGKLVTLPIMLPPLPLQQEFAERVAEVEGISALNDKAVVAAEQLAQSLMSQVFGSAA